MEFKVPLHSRYELGLGKNSANFVALTPIDFLERAALVHPERTAIVCGARRQSYSETYSRCRAFADALARRGIGVGDTVSIIAPNILEMLEAHFGVPMAGAVLNAINTRLDPETVGRILKHAKSKLLIVDIDHLNLVESAIEKSALKLDIILIGISDRLEDSRSGNIISYDAFISLGSATFDWKRPRDEWQAITLNYTSGTTGNPKGVVYHHRGAYLNSLSNVLAATLTDKTVYLWTLPMFHCNGWTYTWAVTAVAGTHVCLRKVEIGQVFSAISSEKITHLAGAPVVLNMIANSPKEIRVPFSHKVEVAVGGAPPPSAIIAAMETMGFRVTHLYGLTECYGPSLISEWQDEWENLSVEDRASKMARQGVKTLSVADVIVSDPDTGAQLPADGLSVGEILLRSNTLMKGYLDNSVETEKAFANGWFHTGDLGVMHEDGYVELKDRSKDIIISGGENISSIEVENVLYKHPHVLEAAVVAKQDEMWGEVPYAFIQLKAGVKESNKEDIITFCREFLAGFKLPKEIEFGELPKTATGKIQKYVLRERADTKKLINN